MRSDGPLNQTEKTRIVKSLAYAVISLLLAAWAVVILYHFTATRDAVIPIAGGAVYARHKTDLVYQYATWTYEITPRPVLMVIFKATHPSEFGVAMASIKPHDCSIEGADLLYSPFKLHSDEVFLWTGEFIKRQFWMLDLRVKDAGHGVAVSCATTDEPAAPSYAIRNIAFMAPDYGAQHYVSDPDNLARYWTVYPERLAFKIMGDPNIDVSYGVKIETDRFGETINEYEVSASHPYVRAHWTDEAASARRDVWLFYAAALFGLASATLLEAMRPLIERLPGLLRRSRHDGTSE